jgi:hypothetical protein
MVLNGCAEIVPVLGLAISGLSGGAPNHGFCLSATATHCPCP